MRKKQASEFLKFEDTRKIIKQKGSIYCENKARFKMRCIFSVPHLVSLFQSYNQDSTRD